MVTLSKAVSLNSRFVSPSKRFALNRQLRFRDKACLRAGSGMNCAPTRRLGLSDSPASATLTDPRQSRRFHMGAQIVSQSWFVDKPQSLPYAGLIRHTDPGVQTPE